MQSKIKILLFQDNVPIATWLKNNNITEYVKGLENVEDFIQIDRDLITYEVPDEVGLVEHFRREQATNSGVEDEGEASDDEEPRSVPSAADVLQHIKEIAFYLENIGDNASLILAEKLEQNLETNFLKNRNKQCKITDFFY